MSLFDFIFLSFLCFIFVLSVLFYILELFFLIFDEITRIFKLKRSSNIKKFDVLEEKIMNKESDVENNEYDNKEGEKYYYRLLILLTLATLMGLFATIDNIALQVAYCGVV